MIDATRSYSTLAERWKKKPSGYVLQGMLALTNAVWPGKRRSVLAVIADQMRLDRDGWTEDVPITSRGRGSLASQAGCSRRTVQRTIIQALDRKIIEVAKEPGMAHRYRILAAPVFELALDLATATGDQLAAHRLEWQDVPRRPDAVRETSSPAPEGDPTDEAVDGPVERREVYVHGPWHGMTEVERDAVLDQVVRRVTLEPSSAQDRNWAMGCWKLLNVPADQLVAQLEACLYGIEDGCRSFAFRFIRGEVPMDDGRPSLDHRREPKFVFQSKYWSTRVAESRAHANGQCGCFHEHRRNRPPKADPTVPARRRVEPDRQQDAPALRFGWGAPPEDLVADPSAVWAGCLVRLRGIHGPAQVSPFLDGAHIRLTDSALEVLFRGTEAVYRRGHVARHLVEDLTVELACRVDLVLDEHGLPRPEA